MFYEADWIFCRCCCRVFTFGASSTVTAAFAGSDCCGTKQASTAEKAETKCVACGKAIGDKDKAIKVEHEGKAIYLCCEGCAEKFKKNPGDCMRDKK